MDKIDIYWFSGSGNTLLLAMELRDSLSKRGKIVRLLPIENSKPECIDPDAAFIVFAAVAEQGTYKIVWDFLESLPNVKNTKAFLLDSLGCYSGGIVGPVKKILKRKGFKTIGAKEILMPNNYNKRKNRPVREKKVIEKGIKQIHHYGTKIINERGLWFDIPLYSSFISIFSRSEKMNRFYRKVLPVTFHDGKCTRCDLCVKLCPVNNIAREGDKSPVVKGDACILCHRCFSFCPTKAISIGNGKNISYRALSSAVFLKEIKKEQ